MLTGLNLLVLLHNMTSMAQVTSSCHHGESSFHVRVGAEGTNPMEMGPTCSVRLEGSTG